MNPEQNLDHLISELKKVITAGVLPEAYIKLKKEKQVGVFLLDWHMDLPWNEEDRAKVISLMDISPEFQSWNKKFHKMFGEMPMSDYS